MAIQIGRVFMASVLFLGVLNGLLYIHAEINELHGVENKQAADVTTEYNDLRKTIQSNDEENPGIKENLARITGGDNSIFQRASAALVVIPQILGLLFKPLIVLDTTVGTAVATLPLPGIIEALIMTIIRAATIFAIIAAYLRLG